MLLCLLGHSVGNSRLQAHKSQRAPVFSERAEKQGCGFAPTFFKATQERGIKFLGGTDTIMCLYLSHHTPEQSLSLPRKKDTVGLHLTATGGKYKLPKKRGNSAPRNPLRHLEVSVLRCKRRLSER